MTDLRVLPLAGVHNFRDYGGYHGADGARLKTGLLWRSAQHGDASDADLQAIHDLGIAHVIDLRGPSEREMKPCRRHDEFSANVWTYPEETAGLALHSEAADGVVVGSALISLLEPCGTDRERLRSKAVPFLRSLREAVGRTRR